MSLSHRASSRLRLLNTSDDNAMGSYLQRKWQGCVAAVKMLSVMTLLTHTSPQQQVVMPSSVTQTTDCGCDLVVAVFKQRERSVFSSVCCRY
mmetsp:Transcript_17032/g.34286  ORF Transcript_17032/g.34286 Transcript_17032/m.34286 type:complete len:92 (+) Transcript_17032:576-851(+)